MYQTISEQFLIILKFILIGILFGEVYDIIKLFRSFFIFPYSKKFIDKKKNKSFKRTNNPVLKVENKKYRHLMLFIFDILYFVIITPLCAIFLHAINNGIVRWYIFLGMICGFLLYNRTIGRLSSLLIQYPVYYYSLLKNFIVYYIKKSLNHIKHNIKKTFKRKKPREKKRLLLKYGK